jgi:two-component system response regulator GlrR
MAHLAEGFPRRDLQLDHAVFSNEASMSLERVLVFDVSPASDLSKTLRDILESHFAVVLAAVPSSLDAAKTSELGGELDLAIRRCRPRVIFLVSSCDAIEDSKKLLAVVRRVAPDIAVIATVDAFAPNQAFELLKTGAADFITSPFKATDVLPRAWRLIENAEKIPTSEMEYPSKQLIGESSVFRNEANKIPLIASCDANVLIVGETGTGKELYARAIHYGSTRAGRPFMPVNCGAIPVELVENELFGHTRGAYTGAASLQVGLIEEGNGGTIFLDEIDCLPIFAQVKLLRFLQEKEYRPLGSPKMRRADVRIIAASNLNMPQAIENGRVRQDLFYRLNIISMTLPPLRDRIEDVPLLARHFLSIYTRESRKEVADFSEEALHLLMVHSWPGNVRELEYVIERAVVLCHGETIHGKDLSLSNSELDGRRESLREAKAREIARFEKNYIQGVLSACSGNITRAARAARKNRRAFWQLIQKHQIDVNRFRPSVD